MLALKERSRRYMSERAVPARPSSEPGDGRRPRRCPGSSARGLARRGSTAPATTMRQSRWESPRTARRCRAGRRPVPPAPRIPRSVRVAPGERHTSGQRCTSASAGQPIPSQVVPRPILPAPHRRRISSQAVGIGLATGAYGLSFGAIGVASGLDAWQTQALSLLMFTGASQFALVGVLGRRRRRRRRRADRVAARRPQQHVRPEPGAGPAGDGRAGWPPPS